MIRMHRRLLIALGVTAGTLALLAGLVLAFSDSQTSAGAVNANSASVDLYICEASEATPGPTCAGDDSGPDETIFEGMENLLPGQSFHSDIRLKNIGASSWDLVDSVYPRSPSPQTRAAIATLSSWGMTPSALRPSALVRSWQPFQWGVIPVV